MIKKGYCGLKMHYFSILLLAMLLCSCAGSINTTKPTAEIAQIKNVYIVAAENSDYIKFKFGVISPFGYLVLDDDPAIAHDVIGNTDLVIKQELEKYGIHSEIGKKDELPQDFDLILLYKDTWRWDFKKVLDKLEIVLISPDGNQELARSTYTIYKNKEMHNFPTPEKEVPKMIRELLVQ